MHSEKDEFTSWVALLVRRMNCVQLCRSLPNFQVHRHNYWSDVIPVETARSPLCEVYESSQPREQWKHAKRPTTVVSTSQVGGHIGVG